MLLDGVYLELSDGRVFLAPNTGPRDEYLVCVGAHRFTGPRPETFRFHAARMRDGRLVYVQERDGRTCPALAGWQLVTLPKPTGLRLTAYDAQFLKTLRIAAW